MFDVRGKPAMDVARGKAALGDVRAIPALSG